jgi:hypothetical protein
MNTGFFDQKQWTRAVRKAPRSKLQAPEKLQTWKVPVLKPGAWNFFGAWSLDVGALRPLDFTQNVEKTETANLHPPQS